MSAIEYRTAGTEDAPIVEALFREGFVDTFGHLYRPEDLAAFLGKFTPEAWHDELADPRYAFRLAFADGRVAGFIKMGPLSLPADAGPAAIELRQLYVLPDWKGQGIAVTLMEWGLAEARRRQADEVYLSVYVDNPRARRFYERYGFEYVGRYDFMVGEHADEDLIMRLKLAA